MIIYKQFSLTDSDIDFLINYHLPGDIHKKLYNLYQLTKLPLLQVGIDDTSGDTYAAFCAFNHEDTGPLLKYWAFMYDADRNISVRSFDLDFRMFELANAEPSDDFLNSVLRSHNSENWFNKKNFRPVSKTDPAVYWIQENVSNFSYINQWVDDLKEVLVGYAFHVPHALRSEYKALLRDAGLFNQIVLLFSEVAGSSASFVIDDNPSTESFPCPVMTNLVSIQWLNSSTPTHAKYRSQATEVYPLLLSHFSNGIIQHEIIDLGRPLNKYLNNEDGFSNALLRWIRQVPQSVTLKAYSRDWISDDFYRVLKKISIDTLPFTNDQTVLLEAIAVINYCILIVGPIRYSFSVSHTEYAAAFYESVVKEYRSFRDGDYWQDIVIEYCLYPGISSEWIELHDTISFLYRIRSIDPSVRLPTTLSKLNSASAFWHENNSTLYFLVSSYSRGDKGQLEWPSLFSGIKTISGFDFKCLSTPHALYVEGEEMGHCVASYVGQCIQDSSHILSCVSRVDSTRSTIELKVVKNRNEDSDLCTFRIVQVRGPDNNEPQASHAQAVQNLIRQMTSEEQSVVQNLYEQSDEMIKLSERNLLSDRREAECWAWKQLCSDAGFEI